MDDRQKTLNLIGLATKAGRTASGVIVSEEASDNTGKMFANMCTYYRVPICVFGRKDELGRACGKEMRTSLAIMDEGFAGALVKQMNRIGGSKYESK